MRAIVLLCLLHAVTGQDEWNVKYDWNGLGASADPMASSVCKADQGSCGCCLMLQQVNRMRKYFNQSLNEIERVYKQAEQTVNNIQASRSAFSVALFSDTSSLRCFGPFSFNRIIPYKHVFLNLGNGYSTQTGIFTVPHAGVYSLAVTVYSDAGSPGNKLSTCANLQVNDQLVAGSVDKNMDDQEDSATIVVVLPLKAGDKVSVSLPIGCFLCDDKSHYNTFSGFLLYLSE